MLAHLVQLLVVELALLLRQLFPELALRARKAIYTCFNHETRNEGYKKLEHDTIVVFFCGVNKTMSPPFLGLSLQDVQHLELAVAMDL